IGEDLELPEVGHDLIRSLSCAGTAGHSSSPGLTGFPGSFVWSPLPLWHNAYSMDEPHPPRRTSCMRALSTAYVFGSTPGHPWPPGPIPSLARQAARSGQEIRDVDRPPPRAVGLATRHLAGVGGRPEPCRGDRQVTGFHRWALAVCREGHVGREQVRECLSNRGVANCWPVPIECQDGIGLVKLHDAVEVLRVSALGQEPLQTRRGGGPGGRGTTRATVR